MNDCCQQQHDRGCSKVNSSNQCYRRGSYRLTYIVPKESALASTIAKNLFIPCSCKTSALSRDCDGERSDVIKEPCNKNQEDNFLSSSCPSKQRCTCPQPRQATSPSKQPCPSPCENTHPSSCEKPRPICEKCGYYQNFQSASHKQRNIEECSHGDLSCCDMCCSGDAGGSGFCCEECAKINRGNEKPVSSGNKRNGEREHNRNETGDNSERTGSKRKKKSNGGLFSCFQGCCKSKKTGPRQKGSARKKKKVSQTDRGSLNESDSFDDYSSYSTNTQSKTRCLCRETAVGEPNYCQCR